MIFFLFFLLCSGFMYGSKQEPLISIISKTPKETSTETTTDTIMRELKLPESMRKVIEDQTYYLNPNHVNTILTISDPRTVLLNITLAAESDLFGQFHGSQESVDFSKRMEENGVIPLLNDQEWEKLIKQTNDVTLLQRIAALIWSIHENLRDLALDKFHQILYSHQSKEKYEKTKKFINESTISNSIMRTKNILKEMIREDRLKKFYEIIEENRNYVFRKRDTQTAITLSKIEEFQHQMMSFFQEDYLTNILHDMNVSIIEKYNKAHPETQLKLFAEDEIISYLLFPEETRETLNKEQEQAQKIHIESLANWERKKAIRQAKNNKYMAHVLMKKYISIGLGLATLSFGIVAILLYLLKKFKPKY